MHWQSTHQHTAVDVLRNPVPDDNCSKANMKIAVVISSLECGPVVRSDICLVLVSLHPKGHLFGNIRTISHRPFRLLADFTLVPRCIS
jgi:hypothetical protein